MILVIYQVALAANAFCCFEPYRLCAMERDVSSVCGVDQITCTGFFRNWYRDLLVLSVRLYIFSRVCTVWLKGTENRKGYYISVPGCIEDNRGF